MYFTKKYLILTLIISFFVLPFQVLAIDEEIVESESTSSEAVINDPDSQDSNPTQETLTATDTADAIKIEAEAIDAPSEEVEEESNTDKAVPTLHNDSTAEEAVEESNINTEVTDDSSSNETELEEETITAQDLEISEPGVLPGSTLYPFKDMWRGFRSAITFNKVKKAELKLQHANERIIEARMLAEVDGDAEAAENLGKALEKYEKDLENVQKIISNIEEKVADDPKLDKFIDKLADSQIKQQKIIQKLEGKVQEKTLNNIIKARENSTKHFSEVISQVVPQGQIAERIQKAIESQNGSDFKEFKNLEILKQIREDLPEDAKEQFRQAEEKILNKFSKKLQNLNEDEQKYLKKHIEKTRGNEIRQLKILDELKAIEGLPKEVIKRLDDAEDKVTKKFENRINKFESKEARDKFLKKLQEGEMEDMRALKRINENISPELKEDLKEMSKNSKKAFQKKFFEEENGGSLKFEELKKKLEENPDPVAFAIIQDLENDLPADKKKFVRELRQKTGEEFQKRINKDGDKFLQKFTDDKEPSSLKRLEEIKKTLPPQALPGINRAIEIQKLKNKALIKGQDEEDARARIEKLKKYTDNLTPERQAELKKRINGQKIKESATNKPQSNQDEKKIFAPNDKIKPQIIRDLKQQNLETEKKRKNGNMVDEKLPIKPIIRNIQEERQELKEDNERPINEIIQERREIIRNEVIQDKIEITQERREDIREVGIIEKEDDLKEIIQERREEIEKARAEDQLYR